jgi:hypothetical protein
VNPQQRRILIAVCFGMVIGPVVGPRVGDLVVAQFGDGAVWQVLPWLLIAAIWVVLLRRLKRVPPTA